jgi:hypothetical protein
MKQLGPEPGDHRALDERRLSQRVAVSFEGKYSVNGQPPQPARISEISRTGLRLLSLQRLVPKMLIKIAFDPKSTNPAERRNRVYVEGRIVRLVREGGPPYDYGIDVLGDDKTNSALHKTVLEMSQVTFDVCLDNTVSDYRQPAAQAKRPEVPVEERRRFLRVPVDFPATYSAAGRASKPARVTEISKTGLRLLSDQQFEIQSIVEVAFEPVASVTVGRARRVCVRGRVARLVREVGPKFEYGIEVLSDLETKCTLQWAVLQVGLKAASKRAEGMDRPPMRLR